MERKKSSYKVGCKKRKKNLYKEEIKMKNKTSRKGGKNHQMKLGAEDKNLCKGECKEIW